MKNIFLVPVAVILIGLIQVTAFAQETSGDVAEEIFTIDFGGGTIAQYVALLKDATDGKTDLNIVVTDSAENYRLPEIQVRTNLEGAIGVIEGCSTRTSLVEVDTDVSGNIYIVRVEYEEPMQLTVSSVADLLERIEEQSLLSAVEIGLEMQGSGSNVTMKLHHETGLLFVKGPESSVELVHQVISELESSARNRGGGRGGGGRGGAGGGDRGN